MRGLLGVTLALLVAGCAPTAGGVSAASPVAAASAAPDLLGTWTGTWAGTPVTLVVSDQGDAGREGLYAGPWMIYGRQAPGIAGVLTAMVRGQAVTAAAHGAVAQTPSGVVVTVNATTTFGEQRLTLKSEGPDRLVGTGESDFGPSGVVALTRAR